MTILITGIAGFIGFHVARACLARGIQVVGVDAMDPYYSLALKRDRITQLQREGLDAYVQADIADPALLPSIAREHPAITHMVHLAAQPGVRYSIEAPMAYVQANLVGHLQVLECCRRHLPNLQHALYASSSSVYGATQTVPFHESMPLATPLSFYAATKLAGEQMAYSYSHLYGIPLTGLRFFTVYGPWGRPDMAAYRFTEAIDKGRPVVLYGGGLLERDFTYIDDIVAGVMGALDVAPAPDAAGVQHACYNLGNHQPETVQSLVQQIERALGKTAVKEYAPTPLGDVARTCADTQAAQAAFGFTPRQSLADGIEQFVQWYRAHHHAAYMVA